MRVSFNGAITGSVTLRPGETETQAISRAERTLLLLMEKHAKTLSMVEDPEKLGPNIGLEPAE